MMEFLGLWRAEYFLLYQGHNWRGGLTLSVRQAQARTVASSIGGNIKDTGGC